MSWKKHDYEDIPGTYVFDGKAAHAAYGMNKLIVVPSLLAQCRSFDWSVNWKKLS